MRNALLAFAVLVPALAWADDSRPYVVRNGRGASAPAAAPAAPAPAANSGTTVQPGAFGANDVHAAVVAAQAAGAAAPAAPSGQAFFGGGSPRRGAVSRGRAVQKRGATRRAAGDSTDAPPPYYDKPGALIRTEGQLPVYTDPGNARTHSVEGGGIVTIDQRKAHDSNRGAGVHWGPADTRPSVNPTGGSGAGGNGVTENAPAGGASGGSGGGTHGNGGGDGNNGNGQGNGAGSGGGNNGGGDGNGGGRSNNLPSGTGFDGSF